MAKIKGVAILGLVKALRSFRAVAEPKAPDHIRRYFGERVLVSEWYPEEDYAAMVVLLGEILADQVRVDVWQFIGEEGAKSQFRDVYSLAVVPDDPPRTLKRAPATWSLYHDTGHLEVDIDANGKRAIIQLYDYAFAQPAICGTITGYFRQMLLQSGAHEAKVHMVACPGPGKGPAQWEGAWTGPWAD